MSDKVKSWWSDDKKWFCVLVDDDVNKVTVSLTLEEAARLALDLSQSDAIQADDLVQHMVDRFLRWRLPEKFSPDCGIEFDADAAKKLDPRNARYEPIGTNLFGADQAEAMVRYMLEGFPAANLLRQSPPSDAAAMREACAEIFRKRAEANKREGVWVDGKPANDAAHRYHSAIADAATISALPLAQPDTRDATIKALVEALERSAVVLDSYGYSHTSRANSVRPHRSKREGVMTAAEKFVRDSIDQFRAGAPDSEFQRGYLSALETVLAEGFGFPNADTHVRAAAKLTNSHRRQS